MTEHPENGTGSHCGNCRNRLFTALRLWHWREPADKLTARSQLAARSSQLAAHRSRRLPAGEEILNEGKTYTRQTHTHTHKHIRCRQEPSVKVVGMRLLLFITIPKPGLNFQSAFRKVSGSREKKQRGC